MPSNSKLFVKPFIGGLNTELSSVEDAILNTSDELNCTILPEGIRGRRLGFNIERDGVWTEGSPSTSYSGYYWRNVNKTGQNIIVKQQGSVLYFYDADRKPFSVKDNYLGSLDITSSIRVSGNDAIGSLRYAIGDGKLIVVGENIYPFRVIYTKNKFIASFFTLSIRDLEGVDDLLKVDEMPISPDASAPYSGLSDKHHYNLLNQGWNETDLEAFRLEKNKWPSNNLQWFLGKDDSGKYNTEKLLQKYFGNTPAPKGHFIIDYFDKNREEVSNVGLRLHSEDFQFSDYYIEDRSICGTYYEAIWVDNFFKRGAKNIKNVMIKFNQLERKSAKKSHDSKWSGKVVFTIYGGKITDDEYDSKWIEELDKFNNLNEVHKKSNVNVAWKILTIETEYVYGADPEHPQIFTYSLDNEDSFDMYGVYINFSDGNGTSDMPLPIGIKGTVFYGEDDNIPLEAVTSSSPKSITDIAYMPGRLFYLVNDTVLFSQIIKESGYGFDKCYQDADPTSEEISDVVPTDGGYIKFNNLGVGCALETFNRGVLVFGENIVYGLISPLEKNFTATEYDILELSRAGIIGPRSAVSTDNMVYYWSPLGIFRIGINPQTGSSMIAECITHTTIQEWYDKIPNKAKETCKGCFDYVNNRIYWYYSQPEDNKSYHKLNRCLVYDLTYNSFMPFKIEGDQFIADVFNTKTSYEINPTLYVRVNGDRVVTDGQPVIAAEEDEDFKRWTAVQHIIADEEGGTSFGDYNSREFKDFDKHGYESYMVSRPIMFAGFSAFGNAIQDTSTDKQVPILQTLFKRTEQAALLPKQLPSYRKNEDTMNVADNYTDTDTSFKVNEGYLESGNVLVNLDDFDKPIWEISVNAWGYKDGVSVGRIGEGYWSDDKYYTGGQPKRISIAIKPISNAIVDTVKVNVNVHHGMPSFGDDGLKTDVHTNTVIVVNDGSVINRDKPYIAASGANIRMRWGWSLNDRSNRWDMVQNGYRPQKDFMHDEYVESRIHVRGRGKAFQVEVRNDDNKDFRLAGMNLVVRSK